MWGAAIKLMNFGKLPKMGLLGALRGKRKDDRYVPIGLPYPPQSQYILLPEKGSDREHWEMLRKKVEDDLRKAKETRQKYG